MSSSKLSTPWVFLILTFGISWFFWIPAGLFPHDVETFPVTLLFYLGGAGPPLAGIILTYLTQEQDGRRDYWQRIFEFRRIGVGWYAVILLIIPALTVLAILLDIFMGGRGVDLEIITRFLNQPLTIFPFLAFMILFGPLPEELGWRGYALERLQVKWSALVSSLILGTAWALWHIPLFFIEGTYQSRLGVGTLSFWLFTLAMFPESILMTWIFNNNRHSTLSAVLFHAMINLTGELLTVTERTKLFKVMMLTAVALVVVVIWGPKTLKREQENLNGVR